MKLDRIKQLRTTLKLSQEALGEELGISGRTVFRLENGEREPKVSLLLKIAAFFKTSAAYILGETDDPSPCTSNNTSDTLGNNLSTDAASIEKKISIKRKEGTCETQTEIPLTPEVLDVLRECLGNIESSQVEIVLKWDTVLTSGQKNDLRRVLFKE